MSGRVVTASAVIIAFHISVRPRATIVAVRTVVTPRSIGSLSHRLAIQARATQEVQLV